MIPTILEAAIRSAVLIVTILLAVKALRINNPQALMATWQSVLVASLAMPFLVGWAPLTVPTGSLPIPPFPPIPPILPSDPAVFFSTVAQQIMPDARPRSIDGRFVMFAIYWLIAALLLLRLLTGVALMWWLRRSAVPVSGDWTAGRDVRASASVNVPVTFASTILLPVSYVGWDITERRAVMAHEASHVSRGDFYFLAFAAINRAVFWFSPQAWWLHRRIADLAEALSDAAAIQVIEDRMRYAEILLDFGSEKSRTVPSLAIVTQKTLRHRVERILAETTLPKRLGWKTRSAIAACILPLAALAGCSVAQAPVPPTENTVLTTDPTTIAQRLAEQKKPRAEIAIDPQLLDNYVGYYRLGDFLVFTLTRQDDQLFVQLTGQNALPLYPESTVKFFYKIAQAQISFITDPHGEATALVLHQYGFERVAPRVDQTQAQGAEDSLKKRIKVGAAIPGSEAALRHQIDAFARGQPDYDKMSDVLLAVTRPQTPTIETKFALLGPLQSMAFMGVGLQGWDVYDTRFANGVAISRIFLAPDGKISGLRFEWGP